MNEESQASDDIRARKPATQCVSEVGVQQTVTGYKYQMVQDLADVIPLDESEHLELERVKINGSARDRHSVDELAGHLSQQVSVHLVDDERFSCSPHHKGQSEPFFLHKQSSNLQLSLNDVGKGAGRATKQQGQQPLYLLNDIGGDVIEDLECQKAKYGSAPDASLLLSVVRPLIMDEPTMIAASDGAIIVKKGTLIENDDPRDIHDDEQYDYPQPGVSILYAANKDTPASSVLPLVILAATSISTDEVPTAAAAHPVAVPAVISPAGHSSSHSSTVIAATVDPAAPPAPAPAPAPAAAAAPAASTTSAMSLLRESISYRLRRSSETASPQLHNWVSSLITFKQMTAMRAAHTAMSPAGSACCMSLGGASRPATAAAMLRTRSEGLPTITTTDGGCLFAAVPHQQMAIILHDQECFSACTGPAPPPPSMNISCLGRSMGSDCLAGGTAACNAIDPLSHTSGTSDFDLLLAPAFISQNRASGTGRIRIHEENNNISPASKDEVGTTHQLQMAIGNARSSRRSSAHVSELRRGHVAYVNGIFMSGSLALLLKGDTKGRGMKGAELEKRRQSSAIMMLLLLPDELILLLEVIINF